MALDRPRIRMVAVDEDGTFVRPDYTFDQVRFERIWDRMEALGVRFAVATGNQYLQVRKLFSPRYVPHMGICAQDGTYVTDGDHKVLVSVMDPGLVSEVVGVLRGLGLCVQLCGVRAAAVERGAQVEQSAYDELLSILRLYYVELDDVDDVLAVDDQTTMMATFMESEKRAEEVAALIEKHMEGRIVARSGGDGCVDILAPGTSKAGGLRQLAKRWGIDASEVVAFGNSYNDLEMIEWAGTGVMMADAPEDLKEKAQLIAPPCSEDGVLTVLEELLW